MNFRHGAAELIQSFSTLPEEDVKKSIPIKDVKNGMIYKKNGKFVRIMEISPINFHLRSREDQNRVIDQYMSWINGAPERFQITIRTERTSSKELISNISKEIVSTQNPNIMQCGYDRVNMLERYSYQGLINKRYFVSCQYDRSIDNAQHATEDTIATALYYEAIRTEDRFQYMDCAVKKHDNETEFMKETLYQYYNPNSSLLESISQRSKRIDKDYELLGIECEDAVSYFAPRTYNNSQPDFLYLDGKFLTFLFITDNGYPGSTFGGWVDLLTEYGENVSNIAFHFHRENKDPIIYTTEHSMALKRSAIRTTSFGKQEKREELRESVNNTKFLHDALKAGQDFYYVNTIITISADTYAEMVRVRREMAKDLRATHHIIVKSCGYHYEEAFKMSLPICYDAPGIMEISKRNFVTESVAGMFPYCSYSLYSPSGLPIGINLSNYSIVAPDFFDTNYFTNPNILIFGASGAGKTYTELILGYCFRLVGIQCMFILPVKGYEYERATNAIGGNYIKLGPGTSNCINVLEIRPEKEADARIQGENQTTSLLSKKIMEVKTFFQLLMKEDMTVLEENRLDQILSKLYASFGITTDNNSIWADKERGILKRMPILADLKDVMEKEPQFEDLRVLHSCLLIFTDGSCKNMNGQTNIDLSNKFLVFDVDSEIIDTKLHPVFLYIATSFCNARAKENRGERCMVFLDEVWQMMVHRFSAQFVFQMVKLIRGYGAGVVIATQDINDFMRVENKDMNDSIINNCATKILLKMEAKGLKLVEDQLELNEYERMYLQKVSIGRALLMAGADHVPVQFVATEREDELFTTDPKKLERIKNKEKKNV